MVKKICIAFLCIIIIFSNVVNGFYRYENKFSVFNLNRNNVKPNYTISYDNSNIKNRSGKSKYCF